MKITTSKYKLLGDVSSASEVMRWAKALSPAYMQARWRWFDSPKFPGYERIAKCIFELVRAAEERSSGGRVESGGLLVKIVGDQINLYADAKRLGPHITETSGSARAV